MYSEFNKKWMAKVEQALTEMKLFNDGIAKNRQQFHDSYNNVQALVDMLSSDYSRTTDTERKRVAEIGKQALLELENEKPRSKILSFRKAT